jgi:hypothetical protein
MRQQGDATFTVTQVNGTVDSDDGCDSIINTALSKTDGTS